MQSMIPGIKCLEENESFQSLAQQKSLQLSDRIFVMNTIASSVLFAYNFNFVLGSKNLVFKDLKLKLKTSTCIIYGPYISSSSLGVYSCKCGVMTLVISAIVQIWS